LLVQRHQRSWHPVLGASQVLAAPVTLRPPRIADAIALREIRERNAAWLAEWMPSDPDTHGRPPSAALAALSRSRAVTWSRLQRGRLRAAQGGALTWTVRYGRLLTGEVTVFDFRMGAARSAKVGYWIDEAHAGLGIMPTAVALVGDHCLGPLGLHRIEAGIRPENAASRRLAEKLGFREEGISRWSVHAAGAWRDHVRYAVTAEDCPTGLLTRWQASLACAGH
jgi:ribosomal-protein-alanine N-acetyltransferase